MSVILCFFFINFRLGHANRSQKKTPRFCRVVEWQCIAPWLDSEESELKGCHEVERQT